MKSDDTINTLLNETDIAVSTTRPFALFLKWLGVTVVSTAVITAFMHLRPDLTEQLSSWLYCAEIVLLALTIPAAALSAVWLCYPDLRQKPKLVFLPLLPLGLFALLCVYRVLHPEMTLIPPPEKVNGIDCAGCVVAIAVVPGFWMFDSLRRHATTYPRAAGAISLMAAAAIGLLVLKLVEPNDSVLHLLQWHLSPMIGLGCLGALLGKKYLSW